MTTATARTSEQEARRRSTVVWVVGLSFVGLVFDGYDLVVYGAVLSTFLADPTQIGPVTPAVGGALGSYALVGVLVGALLAGTVADVIGRRKVMLLGLCVVLGRHGRDRADDQHDRFRADAVRHRPGRRSARGHNGRDRLGVRATREEEPLQRHRLLRRAVREPAGRPARHPSAGRHRLERHVLDRGAADRHTASTGVLQDARVAELVARPRPRRRGPRTLREDGRAAGGGGRPRRPSRRPARANGFRRPVQRGKRAPRAPAGVHERHRPRAGLRAQHLAARADEARGILDQGLARVPAGAQRRRGDRRIDRLPDRRPVRPQAGGRGVLPDRCGRHRATHPEPARSASCCCSSRSSAWAPAARRP